MKTHCSTLLFGAVIGDAFNITTSLSPSLSPFSFLQRVYDEITKQRDSKQTQKHLRTTRENTYGREHKLTQYQRGEKGTEERKGIFDVAVDVLGIGITQKRKQKQKREREKKKK